MGKGHPTEKSKQIPNISMYDLCGILELNLYNAVLTGVGHKIYLRGLLFKKFLVMRIYFSMLLKNDNLYQISVEFLNSVIFIRL